MKPKIVIRSIHACVHISNTKKNLTTEIFLKLILDMLWKSQSIRISNIKIAISIATDKKSNECINIEETQLLSFNSLVCKCVYCHINGYWCAFVCLSLSVNIAKCCRPI